MCYGDAVENPCGECYGGTLGDCSLSIWDNVSDWWDNESVQNNRKEFCDRYSLIPEKPLDELENFFRKILVEI